MKQFRVVLGFSPDGHKRREGDGKTPEGWYYINRRNPNSTFYLSLGISYPNAKDRARAARAGQDPGGDIFIHGHPNKKRWGWHKISQTDWTNGCIALPNRHMRLIYAMVELGTPIHIGH